MYAGTINLSARVHAAWLAMHLTLADHTSHAALLPVVVILNAQYVMTVLCVHALITTLVTHSQAAVLSVSMTLIVDHHVWHVLITGEFFII